MLKRKIDNYLADWKANPCHKPLIVKGARQIGKTESIRLFGRTHYANVIEINFILQKQFVAIFDSGFEVDAIVKNITLLNPSLHFVPGQTLLFLDEIQACPNAATSLKSFAMDGRYDVICSGSLMGLYYQQIESNSVGYKQDYEMHSMDFEEFLWAKGYDEERVQDMLQHMLNLQPFSDVELQTYFDIFAEYMVIGGMPEVVNLFINQGNFSGTLALQRQLHKDYEEDITKYAIGMDKARVLAIYRHISTFLAQDNKKFYVSKIASGARNREYVGSVEWLHNAGITNTCYCLQQPCLPLGGNYLPTNYKLYYRDTGLLIASLDEEVQTDLRVNRNLGTYKGALYENIIADVFVKQGYDLYFYRNEKSTIEIDFFVRDKQSLIPVEVKANDNASSSLRKMLSGIYPDIQYGIKFCHKNIGFSNSFYTFPYFLSFLLKSFLSSR